MELNYIIVFHFFHFIASSVGSVQPPDVATTTKESGPASHPGVVGWHHRLNGKAGRANLPFYILVPLLLKEGSLVSVQMRLVSESSLQRHQRTTYRRIQGKVAELWDQDAISTSAFLKRVGHVYAPRATVEQQ
ncbi:hypothetical protein KP79_PYT13810 [Mizuhopecten yessoensis]|uniref:Secreted protein n=1 Tax=Mizuhopecten yessoensis TaxID=6573 RepID=A0A210QQ72_MIZYE|nr:hypothetical protein KP79_PYT13810 [Mizuhopecten yessoensis]